MSNRRKHTIPPTPARVAAPSPPHSWWGITSFALGVFVIVIEAGALITVRLLAGKTGMTPGRLEMMSYLLAGTLMGGVLINFIGLALGIAGVRMKAHSLRYPVLGILLNIFGIIFVGIVLLTGWQIRHAGSPLR